MLSKLIKIILFASTITLIFGCSKDDEGLKHRALYGTFKLESGNKSILHDTGSSIYYTNENLLNDCNNNNSIEFYSSGLIKWNEFFGDNCEFQNTLVGNWKADYTFYGNLVAKAKFNNSNISYTILEGDRNGDDITSITIEYHIDNPEPNIRTEYYSYKFRKL